jgi:hypothetical protein
MRMKRALQRARLNRGVALAICCAVVTSGLLLGGLRHASAADPTDTLTVTRDDNGRTITLQPGDRFLLKLGDDLDWTVAVDDPSVVSRVPNITVVRGAQGVYEARNTGATDLTAAGTVHCTPGPGQLCPQSMVLFKVHLSVGSTAPTAPACPTLPLWVNLSVYGPGGGFYFDPASGLLWTAERGWHQFSPPPAALVRLPLWVDAIGYGSAGGGFYLDPVSGLVWTAERGWHPYAPQGCV